jgi:hypothetical protein
MPSVNGLPSVTEILRAVGLTEDYRMVPAETLARRAAQGKALHRTIDLYHAGTLGKIHPEIQPFFDAYREWSSTRGAEFVACEVEILNEKRGFCGHLDQVRSSGAPVLIDFKTGDSPDLDGAKYQLAGYRLLWDDEPGAGPAERCLVVNLRKDGTSRVYDVTDDYACQVFLAALMVYRAQRKGK